MMKTKWIRRSARAFSAPIIVYALLMFTSYAWGLVTTGIADAHSVENIPFIEHLPPFFLFLAIMALAIAWIWERVGGIINLFFCFATIPILLFQQPAALNSHYLVPFLLLIIIALPGILFLEYWRRSKKEMDTSNL